MKPRRILDDLEELAAKIGLKVRYESLANDEIEVRSGRCRVGNEEMIIIDRRLDVGRRLEVLGRELARQDLESVHMKPYLRTMLSGWGRTNSQDQNG
ncbi:MAG: hypothetical protein AB1641_21085 [Thermodesulfobacteriota bacterium]